MRGEFMPVANPEKGSVPFGPGYANGPVTKAPKPGSPVCPACKEIYESLRH